MSGILARIAGFGFCLVVNVVEVTAGVNFVAHPGYPAPNYFSGTNSRGFYRASITYPHNHIAKFELYLNDQLTLALNTPVVPGLPGGGEEPGTLPGLVPIQEGAVMFDSFYYAFPNSTITVKCKVYAETHPGGSGQWFEDSYTVSVANKGALFGINDLENSGGGAGALAADSRLSVIGFPKTRTYHWGWTGSYDFPLHVNNSNLVYYAGHGTPTTIYDGVQSVQNDWGYWCGIPIYARQMDGTPSVQAVISAKMGSGLPPFNSGSYGACPPVNIAVHMACHAENPNLPAGNTYFSSYFLPYWNGYGGYCENQGFLGWTIGTPVLDYYWLTTYLMDELIAGEKLEVARLRMIVNMNLNATKHLEYDQSYAFVDQDVNTTLRRVYDPGSSIKRWWRPIDLP